MKAAKKKTVFIPSPMPDSVYLIGYQLERYSVLKEWLGQTPE